MPEIQPVQPKGLELMAIVAAVEDALKAGLTRDSILSAVHKGLGEAPPPPATDEARERRRAAVEARQAAINGAAPVTVNEPEDVAELRAWAQSVGREDLASKLPTDLAVENPMAQRGRKSAASLSIVSVLGNQRPAPPDDLTEFQREVWQRTVASEASTFFKTAALQVARQRAISLSATTLPAAPRASRGQSRPTGGI